MERKPAMLPALTGVRALAAGLVLIGHLNYMGLTAPQTASLWRDLPIFSHRTTGVGIFFALSGFVIFYNFAGPLREGRMSKGGYFYRRAARLWPLYILAVTTFIPAGIRSDDPPVMLLAQYVGIQSWINDPEAYFGWHGGAWSVSTEAAFYIAFPFLVLPVVRRLRTSQVAALVWCVLFAAFVAVWLTRFTLQDAETGTDFWVYTFPPTRLLEFSMGAVTARLYGLRAGRVLPLRLGAIAASALVAGLLLLPGTETRPLVYPLLLVPLFTPTLYWLATSHSLVSRLLGSRPLVRAGEASYALYLFHGGGLVPTSYLLDALDVTSLSGRLVIGLPIAFTLAWVIAFAIHRAIELPSQRRLLRLLHRREEAAPAIASSREPASHDHR